MIHLALQVAAFLFLAVVGVVVAGALVVTVVLLAALPGVLRERRQSREQIEAGLADGAAGRLRPHADVVAQVETWKLSK